MTNMNLNLIPREFDTERLHLRPLSMEDDKAMFAMLSDPVSMEYWSSPALTDIRELRTALKKDIESDATGSSMCWAVLSKDTQEIIGKCILFQFSHQNRRAEIGYILNREFWRQGLMSEALAAVISFAFTRLDLHRIEADVDPDNIGSLAILEKLGFKREGLLRDRWYVNEIWHDSILLGLIKAPNFPG
jgi:ribosomal-protein-alanine N-acetyltransferase